MRWIKCYYNSRLRCYESNERTCPMKMRAWIDAVDRWGLLRRSLHSIDPGVVLAGRDNGANERKASELANIHQLFHDPDAVLEWVEAGARGRAPIPKSVCDDLKQAGRRWRMAREWEKASREGVQERTSGEQEGTASALKVCGA